GDHIGPSGRHRGGERERAVLRDGEIVAAIVRQDESRARETRDRPADRHARARARARDRNGSDIRACSATPARHRAGLTGRLREDGNGVSGARIYLGRKGERAILGNTEIVTTVVLKDHRPREPADGAPDGVLGGRRIAAAATPSAPSSSATAASA